MKRACVVAGSLVCTWSVSAKTAAKTLSQVNTSTLRFAPLRPCDVAPTYMPLMERHLAFRDDPNTNDELVRCLSTSPPFVKHIQAGGGGAALAQIGTIVIKYGRGVFEWEAKNQMMAFDLIDPNIVRIPKVYRFFTAGGLGYIIMEFIRGLSLASLQDPTAFIREVADILNYFEKIRRDTPGLLGGGLAYGVPWRPDEPTDANTVTSIEEYFNTKQLAKRDKLNLKAYPLVFCHLDISPNNFIKDESGKLTLLDWATAGFYPRLFERCTLRVYVKAENDWNDNLLKILPKMGEDEEIQALLLQQAYALGIKHG